MNPLNKIQIQILAYLYERDPEPVDEDDLIRDVEISQSLDDLIDLIRNRSYIIAVDNGKYVLTPDGKAFYETYLREQGEKAQQAHYQKRTTHISLCALIVAASFALSLASFLYSILR